MELQLDTNNHLRGVSSNGLESPSNAPRVHLLTDCFTVPVDYDYTKSTQWNYSTKSPRSVDSENDDGPKPTTPNDSCGCASPNHNLFDNIRETRDVSWHGNYSPQRQAWQDTFVDCVLGRDFAATAVKQGHPWAILTCGAFGAGKGYVRRWMEAEGIIPLSDIVHIDPDYFKRQMPEWQGYLERNPDMAGSLTHRESGYIQEIVTELAMGAHQHVWIDGSLRNVDWFEKCLQNMRKRFPAYQIAIVRVFADEATIVERAKKRGAITGRRIPIQILRDSIRAVSPDSIRKLYKYADVVAHVNNRTAPILDNVVYGDRLSQVVPKGGLPKTWAGLRQAFELALNVNLSEPPNENEGVVNIPARKSPCTGGLSHMNGTDSLARALDFESVACNKDVLPDLTTNKQQDDGVTPADGGNHTQNIAAVRLGDASTKTHTSTLLDEQPLQDAARESV